MKVDHENAKLLAEGLTSLGFKLTRPVHTNMVWVDPAPLNISLDELQAELAKHGFKIFGGGIEECRWVLHHQVPREAVEKLIASTKAILIETKRL
jgi:threonine aldolase